MVPFRMKRIILGNPFTIDDAKKLADAAKKLALPIGKAAWYTCTSLLILGIPLLFLQDREFRIQLQKEEARTLGLTSQDIVNAYGY